MAEGKVLEVGIGSGFNLPFYDASKVQHLTAIDPSGELWNKNRTNPESLGFGFKFIKTYADNIPVEDHTYDSVVVTYTLCTIANVDMALTEIKRVLKPGGKLIFSEHGLAPDRGLQKWQNRINPYWKRIGGGCNLNRDIPGILEANGFKIDSMSSGYLSGWRPSSYNYWGSASLKISSG